MNRCLIGSLNHFQRNCFVASRAQSFLAPFLYHLCYAIQIALLAHSTLDFTRKKCFTQLLRDIVQYYFAREINVEYPIRIIPL